ncbi:MAG: MBL fold metallo-hydrolase [Polyangiaceae bacterium]
MRAHYIDVGQGVATLYEFSCGAILVDTGGEANGVFDSDRALQAYLDGFFLARPDLNRTLDLLVISHPHSDHAHGAKLFTVDTSDKYTVKNVVTDGLVKEPSGHFYSGGAEQQALEEWAKAHAKLETISTKDVPKGGKTDGVIDPVACADQDPQVKVLWGASEEQPEDWTKGTFEDANNHSVVLRIDFGKASFLTTGDLTAAAVPALIKLHGNSHALDADVWEVSHHGSANATNQAILDAITPEIATMGTGDPLRQTGGQFTAFQFGHPRESAVDLIVGSLTDTRPETHVPVATGQRDFENIDLKAALYATGWDGTVVVTGQANGTYSVKTEK